METLDVRHDVNDTSNQDSRRGSFTNLIGQRIVTSYLSSAKQKEKAGQENKEGHKLQRQRKVSSPQKIRRRGTGWLSPTIQRRLTVSKSADERSMRTMSMALKPSEEGLLMWV